MRVNLTDRRIAALKPDQSGKRPELRDAMVPGLIVRCAPGGRKTYMLHCRFPGSDNPVRRAIGEVGALTLERARQVARDWLEQIRRGVDPAQEAKRRADEVRAARLAAETQTERLFKNVAADYLARKVGAHLPAGAVGRQRRAATVARIVNRELVPAWGDKPIGEITRRDVVRLVETINDRGAPVMAAAVFGQARSLFNWAEHRGIYSIDRSPCDRVRVGELVSRRKADRDRVLEDDELRAFWAATEQLGYPWGSLFRLLLLTGLRKTEATALRWSEVDLERGVLTIPLERYKTGITHVQPLSADALALLRDLPRFKRGDYLFSFSYGTTPVLGIHSAKARLDAMMRGEAVLKPWQTHDLRRTVRSRLSELRVQERVAEACLGHVRKGILKVYDRHKYDNEKREALEAWASLLRGILSPPPANVVPLRGKEA